MVQKLPVMALEVPVVGLERPPEALEVPVVAVYFPIEVLDFPAMARFSGHGGGFALWS